MNMYSILVLICLFLTPSTGLKMTIGNCVITNVRQDRPSVGRDHYCMQVGRFHVCKKWQCPPVACRDDRGGKGNCRVCPGTCIDGGKVYRQGQLFLSVDGVNMCSCGNKSIPSCSRQRRVTFLSLCLM
ncbi:uncharacterized protein LOC132555419 [Ylistrum balloti]|uniref:uncharacterized protein LOC132555419 n=1 Tax=Ylistrum balloti TaxID=509963 RepID=UPI002905BF6F|nr:uncharacterized protein LOC132555419 [Ylistrum balloti]